MAKEVATMERVFTEPTSSDYLVCGTCTRNFPLENFVGFVQHKKFDCDDEVQTSTGMRQTTTLLCQSCPGRFGTPWSLLKHAQNVHALQIYLEQGAYSEGVSSVRVHEEGWEQPRSQESAVSETCASPQDESSNGVATQLSTFKEVARQVEHSVMETQSEGDSMDGSDEKHEAHTGDVTATRTQTPDASSARKKEVCCDSEECGISLMPITHEEPKKCCCAVVPKWRKRHMETKHMHGASSGGNTSTTDKPQSPSIFIDLVPSTGIGKNMPDVSTLVESHSEDNSSYSMMVVSNNSAQTTSTERSVIIQPGSSFSIPIRYTSPPTSAASGLSSETITTSVLSNTSQFADYHSLLSHKELSTDSSPAVLAAEGPSSGSRENEVESDSGNGASGNLQASGKKRRYPTSRPFKCDQCDNAFNQRIHLKKHQSKHTGVKPFKCGQCDYSTVERSHLKVHIRVHTGEKPFHCTYCEYATAQNSTLKIHLKRHHANTAPFTCPTCSARFSQKTLLNCHIRREHATDTVASSSSMVVSGPRGINMGQRHLQQSEGYTVQGLGEGYFKSHMESFTEQGRFERDNEDTPERLKMAKELKPHFRGESPHSS